MASPFRSPKNSTYSTYLYMFYYKWYYVIVQRLYATLAVDNAIVYSPVLVKHFYRLCLPQNLVRTRVMRPYRHQYNILNLRGAGSPTILLGTDNIDVSVCTSTHQNYPQVESIKSLPIPQTVESLNWCVYRISHWPKSYDILSTMQATGATCFMQ